MSDKKQITLFQIKKLLAAEIYSADTTKCTDSILTDIQIKGVETLEQAEASNIAFYYGLEKDMQAFIKTRTGVCVISAELLSLKGSNALIANRFGFYLMVVQDINLAFAQIMRLFYFEHTSHASGISSHAFVAKSAKIGKGCAIMPGSYIGHRAEIGKNVTIYPHVFIGDNVAIGNNCVVYHAATIMHAIIGHDTIIHSGARIGKDGFKYATDKSGTHISVPHKGKVVIGHGVEIGANCTIDRGVLTDTIIEDMCKLDNLVQIGHNVVLGKGCFVVAQVGIAGSSRLGQYVALGGQAGVADHVTIGDQAKVAAHSGVMQDIPPGSVVMGFPAQPIREFFRQVATLRKLLNKTKRI
jgi:UDP-3-O-[3-hydroxymyristoyl] glucosamine N-acyltransferase